uniref:Octaprenyl diphosphate synthase n=1 Tax=Candidatus Kentrum eta TaxID=2126337 RepID=A0A450VS91_9GAMM|nr:MAG: octaprenyl-diphosphate synthase [Candidatus Kentron sp. H]VFK04576.1 MAG: octaprenyl-diphosphate synthase [Candidatus Kentron sp. H]VFK07664.1 MAG: octaprenyl-diphosphate synthase [Candidatus Kentron sp. H]
MDLEEAVHENDSYFCIMRILTLPDPKASHDISGDIPEQENSFNSIRKLVREDMCTTDALIEEQLHSDVVLVNQISGYIVHSGGKRLRPLLVLLSTRLFGNNKGNDHIMLAAIIEFIHTATLLHDDVVDASDLRRGQETANTVWGNDASVLVGDFLYSRAFQMMVEVGNMRIMEILADTTNVIAEGEVMQILNCHEPGTTEKQYLNVIRAKTAKLFEAATQIGAVLHQRPKEEEQAMADFGLHLGTAYQLIDDVLDYRGAIGKIGKNIGDDLAEGKPTLPLIHAMRVGAESQATIIRDAVREGQRDQIQRIIQTVESTGAIAYTAAAARAEADLALQALGIISPSQYRDALEGLVEFSVNRTY